MATETQMVGAATATGLWSRWQHGVLVIALSFFSFLPLVKWFGFSFIWFYYIAVVLITVRSLSCKWKEMPFDVCICELLLLS